ncbi:MAG: peroxiredoxin family protein [Myxococcota bacterium]|jgi:peroxiredoxin family protein
MKQHPVSEHPAPRRMSLIVSKGGLDEAYPALILANAARMSGIEAMIFFTFYGLDVITDAKVDKLHVNMAGNPSSPMPTVVAGLPGMERFAAHMMKKRMEEMDLPTVREMLEVLHDSGCELYACELAMDMMQIPETALVPWVKDVITAGDFYDLSVGAQIVFT